MVAVQWCEVLLTSIEKEWHVLLDVPMYFSCHFPFCKPIQKNYYFITAGLHSIRTGASTLHNYETLSGLRFAMYTTNDVGDTGSSSRRSSAAAADSNASVRNALQHIYTELWVESVIKSPLYRPGEMSTVGQSSSGSGGGDTFDIRSTNFEKKLDAFLQSMPWFR